MRIAVISPPFIEIPPRRYGGTELFIGNLARELFRRGEEVVVYGNGDSSLPVPVRWRYPHSDWPCDSLRAQLKNADHTAWAVRDALEFADVIHLNDIVGLPFTMFTEVPTVLTIHHPHEPELSDQYLRYPDTLYVAIARWLRRSEPMPRVQVVHHGIPVSDYTWSDEKDDYVAFLGRMAPCKGAHLAIEAARRAGIRLSSPARSSRFSTTTGSRSVRSSMAIRSNTSAKRTLRRKTRCCRRLGRSCFRFNGKSRSGW